MIQKISNINANNAQQTVAFQGNPEELGNKALKTGKKAADSFKKSSKIISFLKSVGNKIRKACIFVFKAVFDLD